MVSVDGFVSSNNNGILVEWFAVVGVFVVDGEFVVDGVFVLDGVFVVDCVFLDTDDVDDGIVSIGLDDIAIGG